MNRSRLNRAFSKKNQRSRILIVSEGESTEREYLYAVIRNRQFAGSHFTFEGPGPTSPREIVKKAKEKRDRQARGEKFDAVWCVFDVEVKVDQRHREGLLEAIQEAKINRIRLAISNPCFELWLTLHEELVTAPTTSHQIQARCKELNLLIDKHLVSGSALVANFGTAKMHARSLRLQHERNSAKTWPDMNPCTTVDQLIDEIHNLFEEKRH